MNVETKTVELRILTASKGMVLTDGETYSSVGGQVFLGVNDNPSNWYEITAAEAEEIQRQQEEAAQENVLS